LPGAWHAMAGLSVSDEKPRGYATLVEAMAVIAAHEAAKRLERRSDREKLTLPNSGPQGQLRNFRSSL
jgi:hypothetical protein